MRDDRVIVVGAGPAGMAAAVALAEAGLAVLLLDQAAAPGGAVHRAALPGAAAVGLRAHRRRWSSLMARASAQSARIEQVCNTRFGGVDAEGAVLLSGAMTRLLHPRGVIVATGARERVLPRPGWTLPGVMTAGALQSAIKTLGEAPSGRILLAGSGPLLLAVGAELAARGNPPVAIIEAARGFSLAALALPPAYLAEAARYRLRLAAAGVAVLNRATLRGIEAGLRASVQTRRGLRQFAVDLIGLHDGIRPDDTGLATAAPIAVLRAGDCREALGARAAMLDGHRAALAMIARLRGTPEPPEAPALVRQRRAQARLARIFAHDETALLNGLPPETILCRCETRTRADLAALGAAPTARDLRLSGRFGMGACQGRFCAEWVAHFAPTPDLGRARLPARPVALADLLAVPAADTADRP